MRVVVRTGGGEVDIEVTVHDPAATVADLAAALDWPDRGAGSVEIDGVPVVGSAGLVAAGLRPGCEISPRHSSPRENPPASSAVAEVRVVGGLAAGDRHPLPEGQSILGRDHQSCRIVLRSRTTSNRHALVDIEPAGAITLADAGSTSGTWLDGCRIIGAAVLTPDATAALGSVLVRVAPLAWHEPAVLGKAGADGRRSFHRPPSGAAVPGAVPVAPPSTEPAPSAAPRFGWAAALVPLLGGLVLARLVDPRLALFTLLGPAVIVGQWVEEKRRHRRALVGSVLGERARMEAFISEVDKAGQAEAQRRHRHHPDPASVGDEIATIGARLWCRRPGDETFGEVAVGTGPALSWDPPTTGAAKGAAATVLAEARLPQGCPALVSLGPGEHFGLCGSRAAALAVARWVVVQLAAHHGPADMRLAVAVAAGREADWAWAAFLPHTELQGSSTRLLGAGVVAVEEMAVSGASTPHVVVVVDGDGIAEDPFPPGLKATRVSSLTIGPSRRSLPARCTSVLDLDGADGWGHVVSGSAEPQSLLATGLTLATARSWARRLAGLTDPESNQAGGALPDSVRLADLLDLQEATSASIRRRWDDMAWRGLVCPIGRTGGPDGPESVNFDLVADGPHALIAGTSGAGKSELLRSLVVGWAVSSPPDRLALLLVDYKGGAAFSEAARLPHVIGVITDLGPREAARALHSVEAELRRREGVLADLGLRDIAAHPTHVGGSAGVEALPRIVVVIDELAALVAELPTFLDDLVQLAARGRSLGLHLVLGTQRPGGVVSAAVRTNCSLRCCLRVPDEADAVDVVGSVAPAHIDRRRPGRAFIRFGARDLVEVQVGLIGGHRPADAPPVTVHRATFGPELATDRIDEGDPGSDLAALVAACCEAATDAGVPRPRCLWLPPLPAQLDGAVLLEESPHLVLGLVDDPDHQRRLPLVWRPADGPLLAVGSGVGPASALKAVAYALAARHGPGQLHIYGFDYAAQGLASLSELPHVGAVVRPGEHERLHRLIRRLADELSSRQSARGRQGDHPLVVILVDGVAGLRAGLDGPRGLAALDALERIIADGAPLGLVVAVAADRLAAIPSAWTAAASCRLAFRGSDPLELVALGAGRVDQTGWPDGRCLDLNTGLVAQVATGNWPPPLRSVPDDALLPAPVRVLPARVALDDVMAAYRPSAEGERLNLPLGIDGSTLGIAVVHLRPGQPFVVYGPPGSGRTTALEALARAARLARCHVVEAGAALAGRLDSLVGQTVVVVVDDAERAADDEGTLAELAGGRRPDVHLLAAAVPDAAFGHWTTELRRSGTGLVLRPRSDLDAAVLGIPFLPRWPVALTGPGRGVLVTDGAVAPVQVAMP